MNVTIGIDPHKATHTAVAIGCDERELATITVRATKQQTDRLVEWAKPFEKRPWAAESAGGLGYLLAQQLVAAGEHVLDVPATLASRVRVLGTGKSDRTTPTTPGRWPSPHCGPLGCGRCRRPIMPTYCACWPSATRTSEAFAPSWCAGSMPISPRWPQAEWPRNSTLLNTMGSLEHSSHPRQPKRSATSWPWSCWRMCGA